MHTFLVDTISVLIVLGIMVLVHEFGHFVAAKLCGVRVEQFSVGFPPRLFGIKIGETDYCISATPLGGYVKMTGESMPGENMSLQSSAASDTAGKLPLSGLAGSGNVDSQAIDPGALTSHPRWQRIIIGLAGPCANFVLAIGLMTAFYMLHNEVAVYEDQPVTLDWVVPGSPAANAGLQGGDRIVSFAHPGNSSWTQIYEQSALALQSFGADHAMPITIDRNGQQVDLTLRLPSSLKSDDFTPDQIGFIPVIQSGPITVNTVSPGSPAAKAGVQAGDQFLSIDGHTFHGTESVISYLQYHKGTPLAVLLGHDGKTSNVTIQPTWDTTNSPSAWRIGFTSMPPPYHVVQLPFPKAVAEAVKFNRQNSTLILQVLHRIVTHRMSVNTLSGPIGIARQTGAAAETPGWEAKIKVMTFISLNLGILNLLPFPILDGGMILFLIIEGILRHDIDMRVKERVYQVAFVMIVVFAVYIIFNDISKLPLFTQGKP